MKDPNPFCRLSSPTLSRFTSLARRRSLRVGVFGSFALFVAISAMVLGAGKPTTVTLNQAVGQSDPTNTSPINFKVVFSEPVSDFGSNDVSLSGTAGATTAYDTTGPTATVDQAVAQADPTTTSPINFTVVFSEPVNDFAGDDVTLSGTAGATTATVTGSGTTYNVAVSGMNAAGTVIASLGADVAQDNVGNGNATSTSSDNSVSYEATIDSPVRFAVIGDFGCDCSAELDVATLVKSWNPDFITTTGDNNYPLGEASTMDAAVGKYYHDFMYPYTGSYGVGPDINRFFPSLGNHDWGDGYINPPATGVQPYLDYFSLPGNERYYDVVWGPVHIFVIDSYGHEPDGTSSTSVQANWLKSQLAASTATWKLVYFHHPPYSSGSHGSTVYMQWPFQAWGATAVLTGHSHLYERVTQNNFVYFVNGLGGASRDAVRVIAPGSQIRYFADWGAMLVNASRDQIDFQFITRTGMVIDSYTIYSAPSAHMAAAPSNLEATGNCSTQISLNWADNSSNEDGYRIEQSTDGTSFTEIATVAANVNTYAVANLSPSSTYYYRAVAFNALGDTDPSNVANATTTAFSADAPSNLAAATTSSSRITLSWTDNMCSESGFKVERSSDGVDFTQIGMVAANVTTYLDTFLTISTTYYYRVRAYSAAGDSNYSNVIAGETGPPPPPPPSALTATAVSSTQINLSWTDNSADEDSFRIYRSSDGLSFFWYLTAGANTTSFSDTGRAASTKYYYRVAAHNPGGESAQSNSASATTFPPPAAPSGLTATAISASRIDLSWTDNSSNEDGFKIYRSTDNVNFAFYATVGANVTTRSNTSLVTATTYYYRVLAYNAGGSSAYSNVAGAITLSLPAAPSNLTATAVSSSRINLSWTDNSSDESNFRIYRSTDGVTFNWTYTPAANVTTYSDTGRPASTTYYYRVVASNVNGNSDFSNTADATTFGPPAAPSGLTARAISSSRVDLSWTDNSGDEDGFKIYRSTDNVNFAFYFTVGANVTTRSNTNLTSATTYYYRVFAYNSGGNSANSNVATATTLP
jgi:fibronectin type 3 domain-containing protein